MFTPEVGRNFSPSGRVPFYDFSIVFVVSEPRFGAFYHAEQLLGAPVALQLRATLAQLHP